MNPKVEGILDLIDSTFTYQELDELAFHLDVKLLESSKHHKDVMDRDEGDKL